MPKNDSPPMREIDLVNRDPHDMNDYLQVEYDDVFGEPLGTHSADCVWRNSFKCFTCGKNCCYSFLSFMCGICIALKWGCVFAQISFSIIWCWGPFLRAVHIMLHPIRKVLQIFLSTFVGPCMEVHALIFSRIHVTQSQGPPPKPMDMIDGDEQQRMGIRSFK